MISSLMLMGYISWYIYTLVVPYLQLFLVGAEGLLVPDVAVDGQHQVVALDVLPEEVQSGWLAGYFWI
jgi:hypothetical protein